MYSVIVRGEIVDICEEPWYIKRRYDPTNSDIFWWVRAKGYDDAEAVSVRGTKYNLTTKEHILEDTEEAVIVDKETGFFVYDNRQNNKKTQEELTEAKDNLEEALCDIDVTAEDRISALEDVICELDMIIQEER